MMADHPELAKQKYNSLLELCNDIEDFLAWKDVYPEYSKYSLRDVVENELYQYIKYLGSHCAEIKESISDFMAEFFQISYTKSEFEKAINLFKSDQLSYMLTGLDYPKSLIILIAADNILAKSYSIDKGYTSYLYETYHNYGVIFLVMMGENVKGKAFENMFGHDVLMDSYIREHLENHDWLSNVENSKNIDLQKTRDEIENSKPLLKEGQAIVTNVYFDDLWG